MENILTNLGVTIRREVRDIDHMILCDGFQYGIVTYRKSDQLVCHARANGNWQFVMDLEATLEKDKLVRYNELAAMDTDQQTDEEIEEQVQLYYELNPSL